VAPNEDAASAVATPPENPIPPRTPTSWSACWVVDSKQRIRKYIEVQGEENSSASFREKIEFRFEI